GSLCLALIPISLAHADYITQTGATSHSLVVGSTTNESTVNDYWNQGATFSSASSGSSSGFVDLLGSGSSGIHLFSTSNAPWVDRFTLYSQQSLVDGQWLDVIRLNASPVQPGAIRIGVEVHGTVTINLDGNNPNIFDNGASAHARVGIANL